MRILHTADWHVGRTIRGRPRADEHEAVLAEIAAIAQDEGCEAVLLAGDLWDKPVSDAGSDLIVTETLRGLHGRGVRAVAVAGNHDNPRKLAALAPLAGLAGHELRGERPDAAFRTVRLPARDGGHELLVAAVPFPREGWFAGSADVAADGREGSVHGRYREGAERMLRAACAEMTPATANVLMTHVFVDGARVARLDGSERRLHVGDAYAIDPSCLPGFPVQYAALGHVHEAQTVAADARAAYSGSPLQLDFGESGQKKIVRIAEILPGERVVLAERELTAGRRLEILRGAEEEVLRQAAELPGGAAGEGPDAPWLRIDLEAEGPEPGLAERIESAVGDVLELGLRTADIASPGARTVGTAEMGDAVVSALAANA